MVAEIPTGEADSGLTADLLRAQEPDSRARWLEMQNAFVESFNDRTMNV
jgi:hypothetical protein